MIKLPYWYNTLQQTNIDVMKAVNKYHRTYIIYFQVPYPFQGNNQAVVI